eukprot:gene12177-16309_t
MKLTVLHLMYMYYSSISISFASSTIRNSCSRLFSLSKSLLNNNNNASSNSDHLVVLCHGIVGNRNDLSYLASLLESKGCVILRSKANEEFKSFLGVEKGGLELSNEVLEMKKMHPQLKRVSFVGNSLGGLYARCSIKILFDANSGTIADLKPFRFMTIATPHLGVRDFTFLDELGVSPPIKVKSTVSKIGLQTGQELFVSDSYDDKKSLLYLMATTKDYLQPLLAFRSRRLYANLNLDYIVPINTAAFLPKDSVKRLRKFYKSTFGIVEVINSETQKHHIDETIFIKETNEVVNSMRDGLDSCGWEKVIVNFQGVLPLAHNRICALTKYSPFVDSLLGFPRGRFVMDNAAEWLISS